MSDLQTCKITGHTFVAWIVSHSDKFCQRIRPQIVIIWLLEQLLLFRLSVSAVENAADRARLSAQTNAIIRSNKRDRTNPVSSWLVPSPRYFTKSNLTEVPGWSSLEQCRPCCSELRQTGQRKMRAARSVQRQAEPQWPCRSGCWQRRRQRLETCIRSWCRQTVNCQSSKLWRSTLCNRRRSRPDCSGPRQSRFHRSSCIALQRC